MLVRAQCLLVALLMILVHSAPQIYRKENVRGEIYRPRNIHGGPHSWMRALVGSLLLWYPFFFLW